MARHTFEIIEILKIFFPVVSEIRDNKIMDIVIDRYAYLSITMSIIFDPSRANVRQQARQSLSQQVGIITHWLYYIGYY